MANLLLPMESPESLKHYATHNGLRRLKKLFSRDGFFYIFCLFLTPCLLFWGAFIIFLNLGGRENSKMTVEIDFRPIFAKMDNIFQKVACLLIFDGFKGFRY